MEPIELPSGNGPPSRDWVLGVQAKLLASSYSGADQLRKVLPGNLLAHIATIVFGLCKAEPTVLDVNPSPEQRVIVVGDTHGQLHDVCRMFETAGQPDVDRLYILNGDFVDRGSWGVETLTLYMCWKWALPKNVFMLRGNHECSFCTTYYGFKDELSAKYPGELRQLYAALKKVFSNLPLAAVVASNTLVLHGGLFRKAGRKHALRRPKKVRGGDGDDEHGDPIELGSLQDLRSSGKGGVDPDGQLASNLLPSDVLWSDPASTSGVQVNEVRAIGLLFGPDVTQRFLTDNKLRLILRSHEGPDSRERRPDMPDMMQGYTVDHNTPAGKLMTVFSAPDYPQFQEGPERLVNKAAVALLSAPDWATPRMVQYDAVQPRPQAPCYYDYVNAVDSDEDLAAHLAEGTAHDSEPGTIAGAHHKHKSPHSPDAPQ